MVPLIAILAVDVTVRLHWISGGGETIKLPIEEYTAAVLAGEAAGMRSAESLKAMAVVARTYGVKNRGRHRSEGFDLCDTTHCQDFRRSAVGPATQAAASATEGQLLWVSGTLSDALYSKNCGGITASGIRDPYCPRDEWRSAIPIADLGGDVRILGRSDSSRVAKVLYSGRPLGGADFHRMVGQKLGWDRVPSLWFDAFPAGDRIVFEGRGHGHGYGLCQDGCARMGEDGKDYKQILKLYFPKAVTGTSATGINWRMSAGERVDIFSARPEPQLAAIADESLRMAEAKTGFSIGGRPRLWFYPTVAAYRDATGNSGGIAATTSGMTVRFQPASTLRARRALSQTVRHEMLHVVLETTAGVEHPWWFREGLVLYLNNESPTDSRYREAAARVRGLAAAHGRGTVLGWWKSGLPGDGAPSGIDQSPRER